MQHPILIGLAVAAIIIAGLAIAARTLAPRGMGGVRPADPKAAKALGDELLASRDTTVVVFIAHPDDAEWWIGGTLGMLARDNRVVLVLGTSGDAGNGGLQADLGEIRERLQLEGAEILGYADVLFLRHPDGKLAEAVSYPREVDEIVDREQPRTVITFDTEREGPVYHHPDHEAAGRTALAAVRKRGGIDLYLFHSSAPDVICDFGPVAERKAEALDVLRSYHDTSPFAWIGRIGGVLVPSRDVISYGGRSSYPEVGVEYGETFRKDAGPLP